MTVDELQEKMERYCTAELIVQEGNLVTMKLGMGLSSGDYPYVQGTGDTLEAALFSAFGEAERLCAKMEMP